MSGKAVDYATTPVSFYKFVCIDPEIKSTYVGHTTNFIKRKSKHKQVCNGENYKQHNQKIYQIIRENKGFENWRMIEIEKRIVKDKREAERIETEYMEQLQSDMNMMKAHCGFETKQEYDKIYQQEHQEEIALKKKEYRQEHRDEINLKKKEKFTCECGCLIRKIDLNRHKKTQKHKDLMETKVEEEIEEEIEEKVEKRELKWLKNNENVSIDYYYFRWNLKMTYLCVDIRNYHGRPQM